MRSNLNSLGVALITFVSLPGWQSEASAADYRISFDGAVIDLTGTITTTSEGNFSPAGFDAVVASYSITASLNGSFPFTWTQNNSTWGAFDSGAGVTISVTATGIELRAPAGTNFDPANTFLLADNASAGAQENLRIFQNSFGYRAPSTAGPSPTVFFESGVAVPFVLAQVPEPSKAVLVLLGMAAVALAARRRNHSNSDCQRS